MIPWVRAVACRAQTFMSVQVRKPVGIRTYVPPAGYLRRRFFGGAGSLARTGAVIPWVRAHSSSA